MTDSTLRFKVLADTAAAASGFKRLSSSLSSVQKSADKTSASLGKIGAKKATLSVNDAAIKRAKTEIARLQQQMAKDLALDVNADTTQAQRRIKSLQSSIRTLSTTTHKPITPKVDEKGVVAAFGRMRAARDRFYASLKQRTGVTALSGIKESFSDITGAMGKVGQDVGGFFGQLKQVASGMGPVISGIGVGLVGLAAGAAAAGIKVLQLADNMANAKIAFTTMLGSASKANAMLDELRAFSAATPFEFPDLVRASKTMLAFGFAAKDIIPTLTIIGDAAGNTGADVNHLVTIFGQMRAAGKLATEDIKQLVEAGIPAWDILADSIGKTVPEIQKMAEEGKLGAKELDTLLAGIEDRFGGGMAKQAQTLSGMISTLKDTLGQIGTDIGEALTPFAAVILPKIQAGLEALGGKVMDNLPGIVDAIAAGLTTIVKMPGEIIRGLGTVAQAFAGMLAGIQTSLAGFLDPLGMAVASLGIAISNIPLPGMKQAGEDIANAGKSIYDGAGALRESAKNTLSAGNSVKLTLDSVAGAYDKRVQPFIDGIEKARQEAQKGIKLTMDTRQASQAIKGLTAEADKWKRLKLTAKTEVDKTFAGQMERQFRQAAKAAENIKANIQVNADITTATGKITTLKNRIADLKNQPQTPQVKLELANAESKLATWKGKLAELNRVKVSNQVDANIQSARSKLAGINATLTDLKSRKTEPGVGAKIDEWTRKKNQVKGEINAFKRTKADAKIGAKIDELKRKKREATGELNTLARKKTSPRVEARIEELKRKKREASRELEALQRKKTKPKVDADNNPLGRKAKAAASTLKGVDKKKAQPVITAKDNTGPGVRSAKSNLASVHDKNVTITTTYSTKGKRPGKDTGGGPTLSMAPAPPVNVAPPVVNVTPQITIAVRDERLADLIDIRVDGHAARASRVVKRRQAVLL